VAPVVQAWRSAGGAIFAGPPRPALERLGLRLLTTALYILQPIARLSGRMGYGLSPWRNQGKCFCIPRRMSHQIWSETWRSPAEWLETIERGVRITGSKSLRGGDFDRWDLEVPGGIFGACRVQMAVEEHGAGRQLVRFRSWPRGEPLVLMLFALLAACATDAALSHARAAFAFLATGAACLGFQILRQSGAAMAAVKSAVRQRREGESDQAPANEVAQAMQAELERVR